MSRQVISYGIMPTRGTFDAAFDRECPEGNYTYDMKGTDARTMERVGLDSAGVVNCEELYKIVRMLTNAYANYTDDAAGELASSFLATLGIEWI